MAGKSASLTQFTETLNKEFIILSNGGTDNGRRFKFCSTDVAQIGKKIMPQDEKGEDMQLLEKF